MEETPPTPAIFGGSLARTFEYRTRGVHTAPQVQWTFTATGRITCPLLVDQGVIYVADSQGSFFALNARDGKQLWHFHAEEDEDGKTYGKVAAVCLAGTSGYITTDDKRLYELDLHTGQMLRSWNLRKLAKEAGAGFANALGSADEILLLSHQFLLLLGPLFARFDLLTGQFTELFNSNFEAESMYCSPDGKTTIIYGFSEPFFDEPGFFATSLSGIIEGADEFSPEDSLWEVTSFGPDELVDEMGSLLSTAVILDESLYTFSAYNLVDDCAALFALDPSTGGIQWRYAYPEGHPFDEYGIDHLTAAYGLVFLFGSDLVEAVDVQTREPRWSWQSDASVSHLFAADSLLYLFDKQGQITALDAHTGEQRWQWQMEEEMLKYWQATDEWIKEDQAYFSTIADGTLYVVWDNVLSALS